MAKPNLSSQLLKIGKSLYLSFEDDIDEHVKIEKVEKTLNSVLNNKQLIDYHLEEIDIKILSLIWYEQISERNRFIDPVQLLEKFYDSVPKAINNLDKIIELCKKGLLYTEKKKIINNGFVSSLGASKPIASFYKYGLLNNDISINRNFIKMLLNEDEDISQDMNKPYPNNKEYLKDWFSYVNCLKEFSINDFNTRRPEKLMDDYVAKDYVDAMRWKLKLENRSIKTSKTFPLMDVIEEYQLDDNEAIILVYLIKEEMDGLNVDVDEAIKLISQDPHEMYMNRQYLANDSKLVRNGLVELTENVMFRSKGGDIRVSPDITRQVIMNSPTNDQERLHQILKGETIFSLMEPRQTMNDLILPYDLKKTIKTGLSRYHKNIDKTLQKWGLYSPGLDLAGEVKKNSEPGLLMLFHGAPGTGKTFAAGAIAKSLGKQLLITDMSRIQSCWVGESEKNVRKLFTIFERIVRRTDNPPVLLLNEADQFLSRRMTKTDSSVDVMYNTLQNLFLEAFEQLRGVMIATTNLKDNMDTAFSRRFHLKLEFPTPARKERERLWDLHLPWTIPGADEIDKKYLAKQFALSGGQIDIIVKNSATEAASRKYNQRLMTEDLIKYCEIEIASMFDGHHSQIGFGVA